MAMMEERVIGFPILKQDPSEWIEECLEKTFFGEGLAPGTENLPTIEKLWANSAEDSNWSPTFRERDVLREYLEDALSPGETARRIMDLRQHDDATTMDPNYDKGLGVSFLLFMTGVYLPEFQYRILILVNEIRALPDLPMTMEQRARLSDPNPNSVLNWRIWRDLDAWNDFWDEQYERGQRNYYIGRADANIVAAWGAKHCVLNRRCKAELNKAEFAISGILESNVWAHSRAEMRTVYPSLNISRCFGSGDISDILPWFDIAGRIIYHCREDSPEETKCKLEWHAKWGNSFNCPRLFNGKTGFSRARWSHWRNRAIAISQSNENNIGEWIREAARKIVLCMEEIERDPQSETWEDWVDERPFYTYYSFLPEEIKIQEEEARRLKQVKHVEDLMSLAENMSSEL